MSGVQCGAGLCFSLVILGFIRGGRFFCLRFSCRRFFSGGRLFSLRFFCRCFFGGRRDFLLFRIHGVDVHAFVARGVHHDFACDHEGLLVGEGDVLAGVDGAEGGLEACSANHGCEDHVNAVDFDHLLERFRGRTLDSLAGVTKADALKHPNWDMGAKITIDSASLMNKGLEVIEAKWLFDVKPDQIDVVVHPQSIVHSCVQFEDGSIKAQLGLPDMKLPIQYALTYPRRLKNDFPRFNFVDYPSLTFEQPDIATFRNLGLAFESLRQGGNAPAVLNAANEIAVARFLRDDIEFLDLPRVVEHALAKVSHQAKPSLDDLIAADHEARAVAAEWKA